MAHQTPPAAPTSPVPVPHVLPPVTKFVHVHPPNLTTRQRATRFLHGAPGRDATLRLVQYSLRLSLHLRRHALPKPALVRLLAVVSSLAAIRRLLALQNLFATAAGLPYFPSSLLGLSTATAKPADSPPPHPTPPFSRLFHLVHATLEAVAVLADNLYLLSRLRLVPLSTRDTARADKLSDYAALGAALVGLVQVQRERRVLYAAGRSARRKRVEAEKKLEEYEFWEDAAALGKGRGAGGAAGGAGVDDERREEQKRLRDRVKSERRTLKQLRSEVRESRVERVRLVAEGIFAVYDALDLERSAEAVKSWAGITASLIEFGQAWMSYAHSLSSA
ncbi:hypothetical protein JCM3775_001745 [Rhodotorula graminis]